jgi:calcineurin-like phosphoesterase family protein
MIYITSDDHFGHSNIIGYCNRPFSSVQEMDEALIGRWNARVSNLDTVYCLGDFAFGSIGVVADYRKRLNGKIILVKGNHDRHNDSALKLRAGFDEVYKELTLELDGFRLLLKHRPHVGKETPYHDIMLAGHVHDVWDIKGNIINVGVDVRDFEPKTLCELIDDFLMKRVK